MSTSTVHLELVSTSDMVDSAQAFAAIDASKSQHHRGRDRAASFWRRSESEAPRGVPMFRIILGKTIPVPDVRHWHRSSGIYFSRTLPESQIFLADKRHVEFTPKSIPL
jgi:hypothetical protein